MRDHSLSVMSLEEHSPNRSFVGRNFNAGEVIQLVLKSLSGRWLPFEYVQMVMMHELAHCKQMNHSRAFWAVRNGFAAEMHTLWSSGYTGDGVWGRGAKLATGAWERNTVRADELLSEHLCGGTYRSRKRKVKPTLSYQERKQRRILKKFGKDGVALGADDETKVKLEKGKKVQAKPRVAGSARGRELRAAAALARFDKPKTEEPGLKDEDETDSGSGSDYEDGDGFDADTKDAVDVDGTRITDGKGRGMVKVCEDEDADDPGARNELDELRDTFTTRRIKRESPEQTMPREHQSETAGRGYGTHQPQSIKAEASSTPTTNNPPRNIIKAEVIDSDSDDLNTLPPAPTTNPDRRKVPKAPRPDKAHTSSSASTNPPPAAVQESSGKSTCPVCSYQSPLVAVTCAMCANVLDRKNSPRAWRCDSESCRDSEYLNSGDCGLCGLCGRRRAT